MSLAPEFDVKLTLYYEVHDCDWFGGPGSVGYSSQSFYHVGHPDSADEAFIKVQITNTAAVLGISPDKIRIITYEQYVAATKDEEEEPDDE